MGKILQLLGGDIGQGAALLLVGLISLFFYRKIKQWLAIIYILVDAIENIEDATGIVPDQAAAIAGQVKRFVAGRLKREDKVALDKVLKEKNYLG